MCNDRERLIAYIYGDGDAADRQQIESHVETCDGCRQEIRELRRTREDLLAWDVPNHVSVWTPFAPPVAVPWHRQVPRWAMAAAASLMLVAGAAGGALTQMVTTGASEPAARTVPVSDTVAPAAPVPVGTTATATVQDAELTRRIQSLLDSELRLRLREVQAAEGSPARAVTPVAGASVGLEDLRAVQASQAAFEETVIGWLNSLNRETASLRDTTFDLRQRVDSRSRTVLTNTGGGPGGD